MTLPSHRSYREGAHTTSGQRVCPSAGERLTQLAQRAISERLNAGPSAMPARVSTLETEKTMKHLGAAMGFGMAIAGALAQPAAPDSLSRDMAARIEAIPIQTL